MGPNDTDSTYHECGSERPYNYSLTNAILLLLVSYVIPMAAMVVNYARVSYYIIQVKNIIIFKYFHITAMVSSKSMTIMMTATLTFSVNRVTQVHI